MPSSTAADAAQVILVTGANKGIGYEAVKLLSRQLPNAILLLGTRSLDNGHKAVEKMKGELASDGTGAADNVRALELDVTSKASIEAAAARVKAEYGRLDVLMCNAGVSGAGGESAETVFAVNVDGVHDSIEAFLPLIPHSGQIVVVASEVGSWYAGSLPPALQQTLTQPDGVAWPLIAQLEADWLRAFHKQASEQPWPDTHTTAGGHYLASKALVIAYLRNFAKQHPQPKLTIVCPGYCATDINHHSGQRPASKGGESVSFPVLHPSEAEAGQFYQDGHVHPFVVPMPQWAVEGFAKMDEMQAAKAAQSQSK